MTDLPALELSGVYVNYGPYRALFDVSFSVPEGSATALLGSNGSGKSTVARAVSGLVPASAGEIHFDGRNITRCPAWRIARMGLAHAPEGRSVFASLTVAENLELVFRQAVGSRAVAKAVSQAYEVFPRLADHRGQLAGTLSGGEQRMLSLAKVLVVPKRLLVVDELSHGLAPVVVDEVFASLKAVHAAGTSLLVIEQHVGWALELADRVVVLAKGRVTHEGPVGELGDLVSTLLPSRMADPSREG